MNLYILSFVFITVCLLSCSNQPISYEEYLAKYHSKLSSKFIKKRAHEYKFKYHKAVNPDSLFSADLCKSQVSDLRELRCIELLQGEKSKEKLAKVFNIKPYEEMLVFPLVIDSSTYYNIQRQCFKDFQLFEFAYWDKHLKRENKEFSSLAFLKVSSFDLERNSIQTPEIMTYMFTYSSVFEEEAVRISNHFFIRKQDSSQVTKQDTALILDVIKDEKIKVKNLLDLYFLKDKAAIIYKPNSYIGEDSSIISRYYDKEGWKPHYYHAEKGNNYSLIKEDTINRELRYKHVIIVEAEEYPYQISYNPPAFRSEFKEEFD